MVWKNRNRGNRHGFRFAAGFAACVCRLRLPPGCLGEYSLGESQWELIMPSVLA